MKQESSYMIGGEDLSADWRWPKGHPEWRMSSKEGIRWEDDGPLNETGRKMLLKHFASADQDAGDHVARGASPEAARNRTAGRARTSRARERPTRGPYFRQARGMSPGRSNQWTRPHGRVHKSIFDLAFESMKSCTMYKSAREWFDECSTDCCACTSCCGSAFFFVSTTAVT